MKNDTFFKSVKCAAFGIIEAFRSEKNFRCYLLICTVGFIINIIVRVEFTCYIIQAVTALGAFSSECMNTSIEKLSNIYTTEYNKDIKSIKDIAAGGVLYWGIAHFGCEIVYIVKALFFQ